MTCNPLKRATIALICSLTIAGPIAAQSNTTEFQGNDSVSQDDFSSLTPPLVIVDPSPPSDLPGHVTGSRTGKEEPKEPDEDQRGLEWFDGDSWWEWSRASGNWGGFRNELEDAGIFVEGSLTLEWSDVLSGGVSSSSSHRRLLDINLTLDLDTILALPGGTVFADFYSTAGESASADAGDFQGLSNIETDNDIDQLAELWYEQWLFDNFMRIKFGKVEANSEFDFIDVAEDFQHSAPGASPTILGLPTYPDPAMGLNVFLYPTEHYYIGLGLYDGAAGVDGVPTGSRGPKTFFNDDLSDDYFWIVESGCTWDEMASMGAGRFALGIWYHTGDFSTFEGGTEDGTEGLFVIFEQQIWRENPDVEDDEQGLSLFMQYGYADEDVSEAASHFEIGLVSNGPIHGRDDDSLGAMASFVDLSDNPAAGFPDDETTFELFYKIQLTPWVSMKPDVQFIYNPSGDSTIDDAVVGSIRFEITF